MQEQQAIEAIVVKCVLSKLSLACYIFIFLHPTVHMAFSTLWRLLRLVRRPQNVPSRLAEYAGGHSRPTVVMGSGQSTAESFWNTWGVSLLLQAAPSYPYFNPPPPPHPHTLPHAPRLQGYLAFSLLAIFFVCFGYFCREPTTWG